jgi:hypothetical protein
VKDFEGAPLFLDAINGHARNNVLVGVDFGTGWTDVIYVRSGDRLAWRYLNEVKPINADAHAFLDIAKRGAK